jgi:hypothetical protein
MSIPNFATYLSKVTSPWQRQQDTKVSQTTVAGRYSSFWGIAPYGGATPGSVSNPTNTTLGALGQPNSSGVARLAQVAASIGQSGYIVIADRLLHNGGLSATTTGAQTVGGSLTRNTGGVGNFLAAEIYTAVGTTATTITASYTNQAAASGHTTVSTAFGNTGLREVQRMIPLPLQSGDIGVQACASLSLAASTLTAGSFGATIYQPLFAMAIPNLGSQQFLFDSIELCCGNMPQIVSNACLFYIIAAAPTTSTGVYMDAIRIIEE